MYWQNEYLREGVTMTRGQTYRIDLPKTGMLSGIMIKATAPAFSGLGLTGGSWRLLDYLTTIEVIANGATVVKSLLAKHLHYLHLLKHGSVPPSWWRNYATNTQQETIPLYFGRKLYDTGYGLDLSKYDNVELRITNTASAATHGADLTASFLLTYLRDAPAGFNGYLRSELWREWATVQNATQYLVLPSEFPLAGIHLRALPAVTSGASNTGFANLMDDIDFSMAGGTKQIFKGGLDDLALVNHLEDGRDVFTSGLADVNADAGIDVSIGRMFGWSGISGSKDGAVSTAVPTMIADATDNTVSFENREADSPIEFLTRGMAYMNMCHLWNSPTLDPDTLLDPKRDGECRLNIHTRDLAAAASGTADVVLERLVQ